MTYGFILWIIIFVALLLGLVVASKRSRNINQKTEEVASTHLPEIGEIAERKFHARFGRAPTNVPQPKGGRHRASWYPETKVRTKHHV